MSNIYVKVTKGVLHGTICIIDLYDSYSVLESLIQICRDRTHPESSYDFPIYTFRLVESY